MVEALAETVYVPATNATSAQRVISFSIQFGRADEMWSQKKKTSFEHCDGGNFSYS